MHKSIRFKLFLTFLMTTLLIVGGMYLFMRSSLNQGFSELIEARQRERVTTIIEELTAYYANHQNWDNLAKDKQQWIDLIIQSNPHHHTPFWLNQALTEPNNIWPPLVDEEIHKKRFTPLELRIMLLDADKNLLYGRPEQQDKLSLLPIIYHEKTVGYLGLLPGRIVNHASEIRFMERESRAFIWIALLMVALSAFLALLLAYLFGKRLKRITNATKMLAVGNYDIRLTEDSKDELGQLARDFNELAAALAQSEQARRRWVADISHELRTPLAILRGELEALQDGIRPLSASAIDSLLSEIMRLHRVTDDLHQLSVSDLGALSYRKETINPVTILIDDVECLRPTFKEKNIQINLIHKPVPETFIYADPDRLSQLFKNLLTNSVNYTDVNGKLEICIQREAQQLKLLFSDTHPGVPEPELPKLFDRFYRLDSSRNRHKGGAGLGLAICYNIVAAHHGSITATNSELGGLCIHLTLPISS